MNLSYLVFLACPIAMGLMMWMMMRNQGPNQTQGPPPRSSADLTNLQKQLQSLKSQQATILEEMKRLRESDPVASETTRAPALRQTRAAPGAALNPRAELHKRGS